MFKVMYLVEEPQPISESSTSVTFQNSKIQRPPNSTFYPCHISYSTATTPPVQSVKGILIHWYDLDETLTVYSTKKLS